MHDLSQLVITSRVQKDFWMELINWFVSLHSVEASFFRTGIFSVNPSSINKSYLHCWAPDCHTPESLCNPCSSTGVHTPTESVSNFFSELFIYGIYVPMFIFYKISDLYITYQPISSLTLQDVYEIIDIDIDIDISILILKVWHWTTNTWDIKYSFIYIN